LVGNTQKKVDVVSKKRDCTKPPSNNINTVDYTRSLTH